MKYNPRLDGLRAVAVLGVLAFHAGVPGAAGGWMGVEVFFVLSGFLITTMLLVEHDSSGEIALRRFYVRRLLRLYPALTLAVVISAAGQALGHAWRSWESFAEAAVATLLYAGDWAPQHLSVEMLYLTPTWSLSVEEQFYVFWPVLLIVAVRRRIDMTVATGLVAALLWGLMLFSARPWQVGAASDQAPYLRGGALMVGCLLADLNRRVPSGISGRRFRRGTWVGVLGLTSLAALAELSHGVAETWLSAPGAMLAALVLWGLVHDPGPLLSRILGWTPLVYIGRISYGVYLFDLPVQRLVQQALPWHSLATALAGLLAVFLCAALSYRWVEGPFRALKSRYGGGPIVSSMASAGGAPGDGRPLVVNRG